MNGKRRDRQRVESMLDGSSDVQQGHTTLVLGGTGKTGHRVAERPLARGMPMRIGSRSGNPAFDWDDPAAWAPVLQSGGAVYVVYTPDLAMPGAGAAIRSCADLAGQSGVR